MVVLAFLKFLGCLGLLMYGIKLMGESLQKMSGNHLRHTLNSLTTNRFTSLLTGAFITAMIQSSTATSLMTVSFVHAGMLSLMQALPVLMGASVGNTLIAWIMALEFNFGLSNYVYPLMFLSFILINYRKRHFLGEMLFGLCFIFLALGLLYHLADEMQPARYNQFFEYLSVDHENYISYILLLLIGAVLTFAIQSSAVLMATSMILCATGVWSIYSGVAFILGENIGRAIVTFRAASSAGIQARRVALGQLIFNLSGVVWMFFAFPYFVDMLCEIVQIDPDTRQTTSDKSLAYVLAAFHTCFNLCNIILFSGFARPLEQLCNKWIVKNKNRHEEENELRYITKGLQETPEESVQEARKEILNYADIASKMFMQTRYLFSAQNEAEFKNIVTIIDHYEEICDEMEIEIANYLNKISDDQLSQELKLYIRGMLREISEIESIGDSCHHIARTANRNYRSDQQFTARQQEHLHQMFQLTEQALQQMKRLLSTRKPPKDTHTTYYIENEINNFRKQLRSLNIMDINNHAYSYLTGTMYMDIINECEQLADCVINITEARLDSQAVKN